MRAGVKFMAKHPTMVGIGVGAVLGMRALGRGAARVMFPADQVRSFGFGTEADVMGLRANNLNTTALVQALHYRR
jgi:hypothetical protein